MTGFDPLVHDALAAQVPLRLDRDPDWPDVLSRSRASRPRRSRSRRAFGAIAVAAALAVVASALAATGHDPFGPLASWLDGTPGKPASSAEQAGFAVRNGASYAAFPAGTKIRRLDEASVAGRTFTLLGFKSGESLCLLLVRADEPAKRGVDQCVTTRELDASPAPALVAAESRVEVGKGTSLADSIIGFADDTVRAIQYRSGNGPWKTAPVENNVFVGLVHRESARRRGTEPLLSELLVPLSSIDQVRAVSKSGRTIAVPFVSGYVSYGAGPPAVPSYVSHQVPKAAALPGPAKPTVKFGGGTISWLVDREPRGIAWHPVETAGAPGKAIVYSRAVQPDPGNPLRVGLFLRRATGTFSAKRVKPGALVLCRSTVPPLGEAGGGFGCSPSTSSGSLFAPGEPFMLGAMVGGQEVTDLTGVAADAVASLELYLGSGRVVPVALTDNAFSVGAPTTQFPAKLVAFDSKGLVLGLQVIAGPAHPVPCPAFTQWQHAKLPAAQRYQRIDLGALTVDGKRILGMTPTQVEAALGKPDRAAGFVHRGFGEPAYFYGGVLPSGALLRIDFRRAKDGTATAVSLEFQGRGLLDAKLGHVLNVTPEALQQGLESGYGYHVTAAYGSIPSVVGFGAGVGCSGVLTAESRAAQIDFGIDPYEAARPFLTITTG